MNRILVVATSDGVFKCERSKDTWQVTSHGLPGQRVNCTIARQGLILAGTDKGVFRSVDLGQTWSEASSGMEQRHVRWMAYHPDVAEVAFVGTEPAEIYRTNDGARNWHSSPEVAFLREQHGWYLPYSPQAGCVRGFAFHGQRAYAAVEVGGVLVSQDEGDTWKLAPGSLGNPRLAPPPTVHPDVHSIVVHPTSPDLIYAPTGGGFYRSSDGGRSWELRYNSYCRAVWVDPLNPEEIILGPADSVDRNGHIEASHDGGRTWKPASQGLSVPWRTHMIERFYQAEDELLAVLSNGELIAAPLLTLAWKPILAEIPNINAVAAMN
jgi:photosystem II stability/assembly factor-like uncharacterized protein